MNTEGSVCITDVVLMCPAQAAALAMRALVPYALRHICGAQENTA